MADAHDDIYFLVTVAKAAQFYNHEFCLFYTLAIIFHNFYIPLYIHLRVNLRLYLYTGLN